MRIYYPSLDAIHQQTMQLEPEQCKHCLQRRQLVSHGFIRKKRVGAQPEAIGKRVFCSNRHRRTGCGRTMQLYRDATIRSVHHAGCRVVAFLCAWLTGASIERAYQDATGANSARHAYRWLHRLAAQMSTYRSRLHRPPLATSMSATTPPRSPRRLLLASTFSALLTHLGEPLCQRYQSQWQQSFF